MKLSWWKAGAMGAGTLTLATAAKLVCSLGALLSRNSSTHEILSLLGIMFAIGFACGVCVWALVPLAKKGAIGLAAIGVICMNFFFLCCMAVFDPGLLLPDPRRGIPMFIFASLLGPFAGVIIGRGVMQGLKEGRAELGEEIKARHSASGHGAESATSPNGVPPERLSNSVFPLVSFSDGCPVEVAGMEQVDSLETLGLVCRREYSLGCPALKQTRFYSRNGFRYRVVGIDPEPKFSGMGKLLARVWHPYHIVRVAVRLENDGRWEVGPIKERIRGMLDHDPGDLLYQWTNEEEWKRGLESASTPCRLVDFLTKVALVDHDDNSEG